MLWSFDTETYLITASNKAPKPVCCSWWNGQHDPFLTRPGDDVTRSLWSDPEASFVGQNIAYDLVLMMRWHPSLIPAIVAAVDQGRVWDIQLRHQLGFLHTIGGTGYPIRISQADMEKYYLQIDRSDQKVGDDIWRLKYGTLDGIPFHEWPAAARQYALDDAVNAWKIFYLQGGPLRAFPTETLQVQASVALQMMSTWGIKTRPDMTAALSERLDQEIAKAYAAIEPYGITGKGSASVLASYVQDGWRRLQLQQVADVAQREGFGVHWEALQQAVPLGQCIRAYVKQGASARADMPPLVWTAKGWNFAWCFEALYSGVTEIPFTPTGRIKTGEEESEPILPYVAILEQRARYKHLEKLKSTYIAPVVGRDTIHSRFSPLVSTGRVGSSDPNLQNIIERGEFNMRLQYGARPGHTLASIDYSGVELATFAATILMRYKRSEMADAINAGRDLHAMTAGLLTNRPYETYIVGRDDMGRDRATKEAPLAGERQGAKAVNFGGLGGLGPLKLQAYAKTTYGVVWTLEEARRTHRLWKNGWSEIKTYLDDCSWHCENGAGRRATAVNNSGREKANCIYTELANYPFQSLAADGAKLALWELAKHYLLGWFWTCEDANHAPLLQQDMTGYGRHYEGSPLRRSHTVNMVHDEILGEHPLDLAEQCVELQRTIMIDSMEKYTTTPYGTVKIFVEGGLSPDWSH